MTGLPRQVVFLSSIDWGAAWQRHQTWAARFAANGFEVFFVENTGFRDLRPSDAARVLRRARRAAGRPAPEAAPPGVRVVSPVVLPPTGRAFRAVNRAVLVPRLARRLKGLGLGPGPLAFAYLPTATTLELLDRLAPAKVVYDCVDNFEGHPSPPRDLGRTEAALLERAACVLTTSPFLFARQAARHPNVHELHHGVDERFFRGGGARGEYTRFCYFGSLWSALDYRYVRALAEAGFEVTLLGPATEPPPPLPKSVRRLPPAPAEQLPEVLAWFDGLLLPYADTPYNRGVVPAKTFECLATAKPVLSTGIGGLSRFRDVFYLSDQPARWPELARDLSRTETEERRRARVELARKHTTAAQFQKLLALLAAA